MIKTQDCVEIKTTKNEESQLAYSCSGDLEGFLEAGTSFC